MAWFGESLSSLTGHLQNLTKEVLSEAGDEPKNAVEELRKAKEKLEELEAVCSAQDLEITALKKQNGDFRRRLEEAGLWDENPVGPQLTTSWLSIEQRCDAGYNGVGHPRGGHARSLSDAAVIKHHERLEKELTEKIQLIDHLQTQLLNVERERHTLSLRTRDLEKQISEVKQQAIDDKEHFEKCTNNEELLHANNELQKQLLESNSLTKELEEELLRVRMQCLDSVIDSQVSTSEFRSDVEHVRKRIANENCAQNAERLRAHQDMVNRMIQIGEKSRENDHSVKKLQSEDKKLVAEIISQIQELGDQEQQELIHGTLKALEMENKILNMRNMQLEQQEPRDKVSRPSDKHSSSLEENSEQGRSFDGDDPDNSSYRSELSDFTILSQKYEGEMSQLQNQVQVLEKDLEHRENLMKDIIKQKLTLEGQVKQLSDQIREKQEKIPKESSVQTERFDENDEIKKRLVEVEEDLLESKRAIQQLHVEKQCLSQELEAMARIVQDLESKVAIGEEERESLIISMEELDQQHQDALDKLLVLRKADQVENEELKSQVKELKLTVTRNCNSEECAMQTDNNRMENHVITQTDIVAVDEKANQASVVVTDQQTSTNNIEDKINNESKEDSLRNYDLKLCEKIKKSANFDIPNDFNKTSPHSFYLVKEIIKIANESKWKKDTLERKVSELIRENKDAKSTIEILEAECSNLKENIERLAEQLVGVAKAGKDPLPTILENCEEVEILEQRNTSLEAEVEILRETRVNLEEDAMRMREDRKNLLSRISNLEYYLKNQDNLQREVSRLNSAAESVASVEAALANAESNRISVEMKAESLLQELENLSEKYEHDIKRLEETVKETELKCEESVQRALKKDQEVQEMKNEIQEFKEEKALLIQQLQEKSLHLDETASKLRENSQERQILDLKIAELQKHFEEEKELREKLSKASGDLELSAKMKLDLENQLHSLTSKLHTFESQLPLKEEMESELKKWKNEASSSEQKMKHVLESLNKLRKENELLKEELAQKTEMIVHRDRSEDERLHHEIQELREKLDISCSNEEASKVQIESLKLNLSGLMNDKQQLELSVDQFKNQMQLLNEEIKNYKSEVNQKELSLTECKKVIFQIKEEMNSLDRKLQENFKDELEVTIKKLNEEKEKSILLATGIEERRRSELIEQVNGLKSELFKITNDNKILIDEKDSLTSTIKEQEDKLSIIPQLKESCNILEKKLLEFESVAKTCVRDIEKEEKSIQSEESGFESVKLKELVGEKTQEVSLLQNQVHQLSLQIEKDKETLKLLQEEKEFLSSGFHKNEEKLLITKETVVNLSEIIKQKDVEIEEMRAKIVDLMFTVQESENLNLQLQQSRDAFTQIVQERDQLLQTVHVKHQESVQYHNEIQRLSVVLSREMAKNQQLSVQCSELVQKSEDLATNSSPQHRQELKSLQDLVQMRDENITQLCNKVELQDQELRARGMELEMLRHQIETMGEERAIQNKEGRGSREYQELLEKCNQLTSNIKEEQRKFKQMQIDFEACQARELSLQKELERLRIHLVEIEDIYTQEALKTEEQIRDLQSKLQHAEEMVMSSSTVYKSANIRANQQVETLQEQARLIAQQRDDVQDKLSAAEDQVAKHAAALRNLQTVLEQFQRDKEREIEAAKDSVFVKVEAAHEKHKELLGEISSLKFQLKEAKEGLQAASRLGQELDKKTEMVIALKQEAIQLKEKLNKAEDIAQSVNDNAETKVDKSLVKNVIMGYFLAPENSKAQVLHVVSSVLDFSDDEKKRVQKKLGYHGSDGGGLLHSILHPGGTGDSTQQSLSEAFVRFLENESIPQARMKMVPDSSSSGVATSSRPSTPRANTPVNAQNKTPLLLTDVQLPTFSQLPVSRNSSSLLKDILRES